MEVKSNTKTYKSFENGVKQIPKDQRLNFKQEVMMFLCLNGRTSFYKKMKGERPMSLSDMQTIERIFKKYGVTQNIWSDPT